MNTQNFKSGITDFPNFLDGYFNAYKLIDSSDVYPQPKLKIEIEAVPFDQLSINDRVRIESHQANIHLTFKIRTQRYKELDSLHFIEIDHVMHEVFNVYHFRDKNGFELTDITLRKYDKEIEILNE